jgi:RimJ/RimL family protein N-acetyltransferase
MSEALAGLIGLCSAELDYAKVEAAVFADNEAGRRLAERVGFELEGTIRRAFRKYGEWVDQAVYGLLL